MTRPCSREMTPADLPATEQMTASAPPTSTLVGTIAVPEVDRAPQAD